LKLSLSKSPFQRCIDHLERELDFKCLRFRPHYWISDEFFCPEGIPGMAIPFYLLHPRLQKLEKEMMLEVEGESFESALKILRHETGHALEHAYQLHLRKKKQNIFGSTRKPYPDTYTPRPFSRSYVINLGNGYAQAHPDEDFAETFAVWLDPFSNWESRYDGWPALKKLTYIDELMNEISGLAPLRRTRREVDPLSKLKHSLRQHYQTKQERYGLKRPLHIHDQDLLRVFSRPPQNPEPRPNDALSADQFIRKHRRMLRKSVGEWTGQYRYLVDQVIETFRQRSKELDLLVLEDERQTLQNLILLTAVKTMKYAHEGGYQVAL